MSTIRIHYASLEATITDSQRVRSKISDYVEQIKGKVRTPISDLPGKDPSGYASTASSLAYQKITAMTEVSSRYVTYENTIGTFIATAKQKDLYVSNQIETQAATSLEERNWFQRAADSIYNFFCVDLANKWGWTQTVSDVSKFIRDRMNDCTGRIRDWFKYGDGKYYGNILSAVGGAVLAVAALIGAIVSLPVTGTAAIILGVISIICSTVSMVITLYNSQAQILANVKALQLSDEHPGAARYYGNISSVSDKWEKTDMGGKAANKFYDVTGHVIDGVKVVADIGKFAVDILSFGLVKDLRFTKNHQQGYKDVPLDFSYQNVKRNVLNKMKFYTSKMGDKKIPWNEKINWKKAFDLDEWVGGFSASEFKIDGTLVIPEWMFKTFTATKTIKNVTDTFSHFSDLIVAFDQKEINVFDVLSPLGELSGVFAPIGEPAGIIDDGIDVVTDIGDWLKDIFVPEAVPAVPEAPVNAPTG